MVKVINCYFLFLHTSILFFFAEPFIPFPSIIYVVVRACNIFFYIFLETNKSAQAGGLTQVDVSSEEKLWIIKLIC